MFVNNDIPNMNPWLDALVRFGLPVVGLYVVSRALWPQVLKFIDKTEARLQEALAEARAERLKADLERMEHYKWAQHISAQFAEAIGKYNESNAATVRELQRLDNNRK